MDAKLREGLTMKAQFDVKREKEPRKRDRWPKGEENSAKNVCVLGTMTSDSLYLFLFLQILEPSIIRYLHCLHINGS